MRDQNGRFVKGTSGNPSGRPPKERELRYYELAMNTVTFSDWVDIIKRAVKDALKGDAQARKWLSDYLAPISQRLEHTGAEGDALEIVVRYTDEKRPD